ncbi:MAG: transcriptional regulator [Nitrospinae bacterium]|nr:transcriptional regulator [Nitrospinota bacterium]
MDIQRLRKIKAMLIERGIKQKDIAKTIGVTSHCVSMVLNELGKSRRVKQAVADALGMKIEKLWQEEKVA